MEINTSYSSLGVYQSGWYNFRVIVDPDNVIDEQSKSNNTKNQYIQIWANY